MSGVVKVGDNIKCFKLTRILYPENRSDTP